MNSYPSWLHKIPEMLELLALLPDERIDRRGVEQLFDLRRSAAHELLRRFGAERAGNSLSIARTKLIARLREAYEHPEWRWERERRGSIRDRVNSLRPVRSRTQVVVTPALQQQIDALEQAGLPHTVRCEPGRLTIHCRDMQHLLEQLVLLGKSMDSDYELLEALIEPGVRKRSLFGHE